MLTRNLSDCSVDKRLLAGTREREVGPFGVVELTKLQSITGEFVLKSMAIELERGLNSDI